MAPVSKTVGLRRVTTQVLPYFSFPFKAKAGDEGLRQQLNEGKISYATLLNSICSCVDWVSRRFPVGVTQQSLIPAP